MSLVHTFFEVNKKFLFSNFICCDSLIISSDEEFFDSSKSRVLTRSTFSNKHCILIRIDFIMAVDNKGSSPQESANASDCAPSMVDEWSFRSFLIIQIRRNKMFL